jgi:nitrite reductase/ring-hydroxylating ferredoxin subunit
MGPDIMIVRADQLPADGAMVHIEQGDRDVLVASINGQLFALDNRCTHAAAWLDQGTLQVDTYEVRCPLHGGRFDVRTGRVTHKPCREPVRSYPIERTGPGATIHVSSPKEPMFK